MSGFHEIRFPDNIAYGATGGPEFATTVVVTGAGQQCAVAGGLVGTGLAFGGIRLLARVLPAEIPRAAEIGLDPQVMLFTALVTLLAGALFGLLPALRLMRPRISACSFENPAWANIQAANENRFFRTCLNT